MVRPGGAQGWAAAIKQQAPKTHAQEHSQKGRKFPHSILLHIFVTPALKA
jgi:hypothetical protein